MPESKKPGPRGGTVGATDRDPKQRPSEGMESLIFRTSVVIIYVDIEFAIHLILFFFKTKATHFLPSCYIISGLQNDVYFYKMQ